MKRLTSLARMMLSREYLKTKKRGGEGGEGRGKEERGREERRRRNPT